MSDPDREAHRGDWMEFASRIGAKFSLVTEIPTDLRRAPGVGFAQGFDVGKRIGAGKEVKRIDWGSITVLIGDEVGGKASVILYRNRLSYNHGWFTQEELIEEMRTEMMD